MNEARFFWFFLYLIDLRNNAKEKKLRSLLDPTSVERTAHCREQTRIVLGLDENSTPVLPLEPSLPYRQHENGSHACNYCGKQYKQLASLNKHLDKNHQLKDVITYQCDKCNQLFVTK